MIQWFLWACVASRLALRPSWGALRRTELAHLLLWSRFHRNGLFARGWRGLGAPRSRLFHLDSPPLPRGRRFPAGRFQYQQQQRVREPLRRRGCGDGFRRGGKDSPDSFAIPVQPQPTFALRLVEKVEQPAKTSLPLIKTSIRTAHCLADLAQVNGTGRPLLDE